MSDEQVADWWGTAVSRIEPNRIDLRGHPVQELIGTTGDYGFRSTRNGEPLDSFGRNLYLDTFDSAYGAGWRRENSFLTHKYGGSFCYGFYPHGSHPAGKGTKYRAIIIGPGVTPDVMWHGNAPGPYNPWIQAISDLAILGLNDPQCKPV